MVEPKPAGRSKRMEAWLRYWKRNYGSGSVLGSYNARSGFNAGWEAHVREMGARDRAELVDQVIRVAQHHRYHPDDARAYWARVRAEALKEKR